MLENIEIKGFKSLKNVNISLNNINVVIGANGAGKSNFIRFFEFLKNKIVGNEPIRPEDIDKYLYCGARNTKSIFISLKFLNIEEKCHNEYKILLELNDDRSFIYKDEEVIFNSKRHKNKRGNLNNFENPIKSMIGNSKDPKAFYTLKYINSCRVYHFNDTGYFSDFRKSSLLSNNEYLETSGGNLSSILYRIKQQNLDIYDLIIRRIQIILPFFEDFVLSPYILENEERISLKWKQKFLDSVFDVSALSDGSIRFIALVVLINLPKDIRPDVIIIDEPELGLHYQAVVAIGTMIKETVSLYNTQFIISTQSLEFVNNFNLNDIIVANRNENQTLLKRATIDEDGGSVEYTEWLKQFSNSELWEKNLIGGNIDI